MSRNDINKDGFQAYLGELPVTSRYTYGLAGERFFSELKTKGTIFGTRCQSCDLIYVPAVSFCERCMSKLEEWMDMGLIGHIHSYTVLYEMLSSSESDQPVIVGIIKIGDGGIIHKIKNIDPKQVKFEMEVEAVLKDEGDRDGAITDILYFQPV